MLHRAAWLPFAVCPSRPAPAPVPRTLLDVLDASAARFPTAAAIDDGRRVLTYAALIGRLHKLCDRLAAAGIDRGDRIGIRVSGLSVAFDASCEQMWLAWRHGGCLVPVPRALAKMGADLGLPPAARYPAPHLPRGWG
jgi:non-ribosomal peptide synthetase component F